MDSWQKEVKEVYMLYCNASLARGKGERRKGRGEGEREGGRERGREGEGEGREGERERGGSVLEEERKGEMMNSLSRGCSGGSMGVGSLRVGVVSVATATLTGSVTS